MIPFTWTVPGDLKGQTFTVEVEFADTPFKTTFGSTTFTAGGGIAPKPDPEPPLRKRYKRADPVKPDDKRWK